MDGTVAVGATALLLNLGTVVVNLRTTTWTRRSGNAEELRAIVDALAPVVDPGAAPQAVTSLWSPLTATMLADLIDRAQRQPDRRVRRRITTFHGQILRVRGMNQPALDQSGFLPEGAGTLSADQRDALAQARDQLKKIKARLNTIARRGGAGSPR
jgi:hypothetical protein